MPVVSDLARAAILSVFAAGSAAAQTGNIELELNTAADVDGVCRLTYVATNATRVALDNASYEVAIFNTDGIFQRFLVLEFGWLPVGKTRVVQFDLPEQGCADVSRISINEAVECVGAEGPQTVCRDGQLLSSRVPTIQFN